MHDLAVFCGIASGQGGDVLKNEQVMAIAEKHQKSAAQVFIRYEVPCCRSLQLLLPSCGTQRDRQTETEGDDCLINLRACCH